ncbi:hypothetical protein [Mesorhizobium sp.]|uniref:hypothetical protein n=1 Tax=Mesorhizobium sp. TaxID=1871066 RepID=UPI000FE52CC9|nr:hypothetical protein [Mesorhizobium sp.]RWK27515.1 MAG: hypothetical protein EOR44_26930 [Mesorhizobium sp.]
MFTWEGGKGACIAVPVEGAAIDFSARPIRRDQIIENLDEFCQSWLARGMSITRDAPVYEVQLLDSCFYNPMRSGAAGVEIGLDRFEFMRPDRMGYLPGPLVYRCDTCEKVREYISAAHQVADPLSPSCSQEGSGTRECRWRQLDVVYVHWSGTLEGLSPYRYSVGADGEVRKIPRCQCGSEEFKLIKQGNQFSLWRFRCTGCSAEREVYQTDPFSLSFLKSRMDQGVPHQWSEINMIPVSYRASPVFYVQSARFIVYDADPEVVALMQPSRHSDLTAKIAALHGYGGADPSDQRIREQLQAKGRASQWPAYEAMRMQERAMREAGNDVQAAPFAEAAGLMLQGWYDAGDVVREAVATPELEAQIRARGDFARRFDPIRSTVEHDALRRRKIGISGEAHDLRQVHADLCAEYGVPELEQAYVQRVGEDLGRAGIQDAYLIRNLDMVEFSFGFTRVSATPMTVQKDRPMPVRLMGFPSLPNHKRPIYVIEQQNEALYIRLQPDAVAEYLIRNGVLETAPAAPRTLGATLIEQYQDFGPFLQGFSVRDPASRERSRDVPALVYLLLHTMAHHVMQGIARFSGLDLGSMSEAIFPADLAFLVHRRGMTEDLGNISSMWRDHNGAFLHYLVARRELRCGSGTLCDHRGGACPACVMVPETSCIAGNQLLSRAALVGGRAPLWDMDQSQLQGYFEIVHDLRSASGPPGDA